MRVKYHYIIFTHQNNCPCPLVLVYNKRSDKKRSFGPKAELATVFRSLDNSSLLLIMCQLTKQNVQQSCKNEQSVLYRPQVVYLRLSWLLWGNLCFWLRHLSTFWSVIPSKKKKKKDMLAFVSFVQKELKSVLIMCRYGNKNKTKNRKQCSQNAYSY